VNSIIDETSSSWVMQCERLLKKTCEGNRLTSSEIDN